MSNLFNTSIVKGKWSQLKGFAQTQWGRITGNELDEVKGQLKEVGGFARQKVGEAQDKVRRGIDKNVASIGMSDDKKSPRDLIEQ